MNEWMIEWEMTFLAERTTWGREAYDYMGISELFSKIPTQDVDYKWLNNFMCRKKWQLKIIALNYHFSSTKEQPFAQYEALKMDRLVQARQGKLSLDLGWLAHKQTDRWTFVQAEGIIHLLKIKPQPVFHRNPKRRENRQIDSKHAICVMLISSLHQRKWNHLGDRVFLRQ